MAGKIIPGSPGGAMPRPNPPTFSPLGTPKPFGTRVTPPSGSSVAGLDTAMGAHADELHPLKPRRTV